MVSRSATTGASSPHPHGQRADKMAPVPFALIDPGRAGLAWYLARSSGFVVYLLVTASVCLGMLLSLKWRSDTWPRMITEELHRYIMLTAGAFLALHIVSI